MSVKMFTESWKLYLSSVTQTLYFVTSHLCGRTTAEKQFQRFSAQLHRKLWGLLTTSPASKCNLLWWGEEENKLLGNVNAATERRLCGRRFKEQPGYQAGAWRQQANTWEGHTGVSCSSLIMNLLHYLEAVSCLARSSFRSGSELAWQ